MISSERVVQREAGADSNEALIELPTSGQLSLLSGAVGPGLRSKASPSLASFVTMSKKLDGRDKLTKIVQYGSRFLFWWFSRGGDAGGSKEMAARAYKLYRTTQLSRKAFRLLKVLEEVHTLRTVLNNDTLSPEKRALLALRTTAMGSFWTFDNLNYLTTTDTVAFGNERALKGFGRSWAIASVVVVYLGLQSVRSARRRVLALCEEQHQQRQQQGESSAAVDRELEVANVALFKAHLSVLKGVMDLMCAVNMPGTDLPLKLWGSKWNNGVVGVAGCVSALTVLYNNWPDAAAPAAPTEAKKES